jgi:hypothetical protein
MSISIAICETECKSASCKRYKENILRVHVKDPGTYGDAADTDMFLASEKAMDAFEDKAGFMKRNRIGEDTKTIYLDRLKDDSDRAVLERITERTYTGWVDVSKVSDDMRERLLADSLPENRQTEWDTVSFEDTYSMCGECKLSWDKGRGCIGSFGPDNSALPGIAEKYGCKVVSSVPDGVRDKKIYTKEDAMTLLSEEIPVLRDALVKEGKLAVRRYSGVLDRIEAVAKISADEGCGFFFL